MKHEQTCEPQDPRHLLSEQEDEPVVSALLDTPLPVISPLLAALLGGDAPATEQVSRQAQQAIPVSVCTAEQQKAASREHMAKLHERSGTYDFGAKHRLPKETVLEGASHIATQGTRNGRTEVLRQAAPAGESRSQPSRKGE